MADKKKRGSHLRIRTKLVIYFSVLLAIPILILGFYTYHQSKENFERQSIITIENNLSGILNEMEARAAREATYIKYLAYNLNFRKLLEASPVDRVEMAMELNNSVEPILWYYITSDSYVKGIEIITDHISLYKIVKSLGLMNSVFAVILVNTAINLPQSIFLSKEFVTSTVPMELEEAADIDGITVFGKFFRIVLPLMKPVMSTTIIIVTLNVWNEFMTPLLFIQSRENDVILQEVSRNIGQFATDWTAMFPMLMLGVAPLMIFYVFMQKYIIGGVAAGAVKG